MLDSSTYNSTVRVVCTSVQWELFTVPTSVQTVLDTVYRHESGIYGSTVSTVFRFNVQAEVWFL